jgi:hypothetical protein
MKNAIALAGLFVMIMSPATAACYGGPAFQTCNALDRDSDTADSAGVTTMRGYNAQHGIEWNEAISDSRNKTHGEATSHGSARANRTTPQHQTFFYVCTPYRGCS